MDSQRARARLLGHGARVRGAHAADLRRPHLLRASAVSPSLTGHYTRTLTLSSLSLFLYQSLFELVHAGAVSAAALGSLDFFLGVAGFAVLRAGLGVPLSAQDSLGSSLLFCATLSLLSPVLRTLTESFADDTIWALAYFLAMLHLVTHDYNYVNAGIGR